MVSPASRPEVSLMSASPVTRTRAAWMSLWHDGQHRITLPVASAPPRDR